MMVRLMVLVVAEPSDDLLERPRVPLWQLIERPSVPPLRRVRLVVVSDAAALHLVPEGSRHLLGPAFPLAVVDDDAVPGWAARMDDQPERVNVDSSSGTIQAVPADV